jgi:hypothetical protein
LSIVRKVSEDHVKRPGDRVRLYLPGSYDALTLSGCLRVDALPKRPQALLLKDGYGARWNARTWNLVTPKAPASRILRRAELIKFPPGARVGFLHHLTSFFQGSNLRADKPAKAYEILANAGASGLLFEFGGYVFAAASAGRQ